MNESFGSPDQNIPQRSVTLEADKPFNVVITGNENTDTAIILVHGFGVKSESRGLFTDIEKQVASSAVAVRGDYADSEEGSIHAIPFSDQVRRLRAVIDYTKNYLGKDKLIFIGHSQGGIVVAEAKPEGSQVFLLAPPIESPFSNFITTDGWRRPGSSLNLDGESLLSRSDGSTTFVGKSFWDEIKKVDAEKIYQNLSEKNELNIVFAGEDQVLGEQIPPPNINSFSIEYADHDFRGNARGELLKELAERMKLKAV